MPNAIDVDVRDLMLTLITHGPLDDYSVNPSTYARAAQGNHVMRISYRGTKVILTESGYGKALTLLGLKPAPSSASTRVTRALEDLIATPNLRQSDIIRTLIQDAGDDIGTQQMLWVTYHTEGQYREFHQQYTQLALSPHSAKDAAYYALCFIHGLRPLLDTGWETDRGGIEHSLRYPNICRAYDDEERVYDYSIRQLTFEYYCDPHLGEVTKVGADWGNAALTKIPPVPFVQFYADPNGRIPVNTLDSNYMSEVSDLKTEYLESTLVLPEAMANEVAREATRVITSSYNQYPNNSSVSGMMRSMRRQVSPYVYDAVEYALSTKPATPVSYGSFELLPITVLGDSASYFEVCWVIPEYKKPTLTVRRVGGRNVRII